MAAPLGRSRVTEFLELRGKSQVDLAIHLDVTEGYISQVCNDLANLSVINMKRTARFLFCPMDDLLYWDESQFKPIT
jgi:transcriptional regulator with XRE-family HTH domain